MVTIAKKPFVFGSRPSHVHELGDGTKIECNSAYCDYMDAHPLHQENQRPPWKNVEEK